MRRLLALETSSDACSAALLLGERILQRLEMAPRGHGERILGMMDALLREADLALADLDAIAFGRGPGSFTGVRIAVAVAQGSAFGAGLPLVGVSTLAGIAQGEWRRHGRTHGLVALDARMDEIYWGCFTIDAQGLASPVRAERVCAPEQVARPHEGSWWGMGSGWAAYHDVLIERTGLAPEQWTADAICEARDIAVLGAAAFARGERLSPERATPSYLRDQVTRVG